MEMFIGIATAVAAAYLIILPFWTVVENVKSKILFHIIPAFLGLVMAFVSLHYFGFIVQVG